MRAIWTGALSFGLVNIPVKMYSATAGTELKFHFLHRKDHSTISYVKFCRQEGIEVPSEDIEKGYEYRKGDYVILSEEDFAKANVSMTRTIDIVDFAKTDEINTVYYEKPYFLEPDKGAEKPYVLLREALKRSGKVGIAKFVIRQREHLGVIKPEGDVILLDQLRFADEVRSSEELKLPGAQADKREIDMALALIDHLTQPFKPEHYKDTYKQELQRVIEEKAQGKTVTVHGQPPEPTAVKDLMAMLKASLEKEQKTRA